MSVYIIYIYESKHQEMNINTMLQLLTWDVKQQNQPTNAATRSNKYNVKNLAMAVKKPCVNQKIRTTFFKN